MAASLHERELASDPTHTWHLVERQNRSSSIKSEVKMSSTTAQFLIKCYLAREQGIFTKMLLIAEQGMS
jgi:hypothetical protein